MSTAVERVQEYLRQRKLLSRDLGIGIHAAWADPDAPGATLTVPDVEALLALATKPEEPVQPQYKYKYAYIRVDSTGYYHPRWDRAVFITVVAPTKEKALLAVWAAAGEAPRGWHWSAKLQSVDAVGA